MTPKNLDNLVYRIFYFLLVWLVKLNTGVHCYIVLVLFYFAYFNFYLIWEEINQIYTITWLVFEVYKMDFRTLLAQLVSMLRVKLWKVLIRGKNMLFFFYFWNFLSKCTIFVFVTYFSHLVVIFQCRTYL